MKNLYETSGMFNTLIDNCMMSMTKSNFDITAYMKDDEEFGEFWTTLKDEYDRTKKYLLKLTGMSELMENYPVEKASILEREKIILPLLIIQHYAIRLLDNEQIDDAKADTYRKLIGRTIYGVVNAGRNLA